MYYKVFYLLIRQLVNKKISRGLFLHEWAEEQKRQKIKIAEKR
jgi:hypothetical protein